MRTFDNDHIHRKGKIKRKGENSNLKKVQRFVASLSSEQVSRMISDSGKPYAEKGADITARSIYENSLKSQSKIQPKLEISHPQDRSEAQADKVAEGVVKGDTGLSRSALEKPVSDISAKSEGGMTTTPQFDQQLGGTKGQGQKLDTNVRSEMESHLGSDLSGVNVHTSGDAKTMSEDINAKAFTHGQDVYFNEGQYNPSSTEGKSLLAHELTHTVQQGNGVGRKIQRFGAESHEKVESNALTKNTKKGKGLNSAEARATYYGNWTRDFNQFLAPGPIVDIIGFSSAYALVAFMAAQKFGKIPSLTELGVYNPKEHIDNPGAIFPGQDIYTEVPNLIGNIDVGTTNKPKPTEQTNINIDTKKPDASGWTETGATLLSVDQTGVMAYIRDSNFHVERRLEQAADKGRTDAGLFHFGVALHAIEDLFAHSNYVEIALARILKEDPTLLASQLTEEDRNVYDYMPSVSGPDGKSRAVLTTGTFSPQDAKISLSYEVISFLDSFQLNKPNAIEFDTLTEMAFVRLLQALNNTPTVKNAIGEKIGNKVAQVLDNASLGLKVKNFVEQHDLGVLYQNLKKWSEMIGDYFLMFSDYTEYFFKTFLTAVVKQTMLWLKQKLLELAAAGGVETAVAKTPLNEEEKRIVKENGELASLKKPTKRQKELAKYNAAHLTMYNNRETQAAGKMLTSGPSHSQLAKDHPESIFFGLAFRLAEEADLLLRDKLYVAWDGKTVQARSAKEIQEADAKIKGPKAGGNSIEAYGSTSADIYNLEAARKKRDANLSYAITLMNGQQYADIKASLTNIRKDFKALDLYNYKDREALYQRLDDVIEDLNNLKGGFFDYVVTKANILSNLLPVSAFLAPAFYKEQKDNIENTRPETITRSNINLSSQNDLSKKTPAIKDLLETSRKILGHPNDSDWWKAIVKSYITKFPTQIAMEIKLKNAGYVDKKQANGK